MRVGSSRDQLLLEMKTARARVLDAVAGLTEEEITRPEIDGWSVKDHLAHLAAWDELRYYEISRVSQGYAPAFLGLTNEQVEAFNEIAHALRRGFSPAQVLWELESARSRVLKAIADCPEERLQDLAAEDVPLRARGAIHHDSEHADYIREWRREEGI